VEIGTDASAVVRASNIVLVSLPSGRVLESLARGKGGLLESVRSGQILVDLGTSPVALTRKLAAEFAERGVRYLDAPVARTRQAAEAGTLSVMIGGDAETLAAVRPVIACFAEEITHCGAIGSGQVAKILNNMVLFETLAKGSADSFALRNHGMKAIVPQAFPPRAFSVEYAKKDLAYALELAADAGVDPQGAQRVDRLFDEAISRGAGDQYHPVVSRIVSGSL
jgi:3-hydroxyisobutyrate dehydrogenase-like beta-hydroxyacid dehydrogenase